MRNLFFAVTAISILLTSCTRSQESLITGSWKCTTLKINGTEILGTDSATTNLVNTYNLNNSGQISSDAGIDYFTYSIGEFTLTHYTAGDTIIHTIDTLTEDRLRMHVTIDTVTYDGGYSRL